MHPRIARFTVALALAAAPLAAQLTVVGGQRWSQSALGSLVEAGDRFGAALAVGDFDGDSYDDLAIGLPGEGVGAIAGAGGVLIVYGTPTGLNGAGALPVLSLHQDVTGVLGEAETGDAFGTALATGDFDDDGFDDLAVGVPLEDVEISPGVIVSDAGVIQVFYGSLSGIVAADDQAFAQENLSGSAVSQAGDEFGAAISRCYGGLVDDAYDDLLIGSPGDNFGGLNDSGGIFGVLGTSSGLTSAGAFYQGADGTTTPPAAGDLFGSAVHCARYGDAENFRGIGIGAPFAEASGAGSAAGIVRAAATSLGGSTIEISFPNAGGHAGSALRFVNWPDSSSEFDLLIGIPGNDVGGSDEAGRIYAAASDRPFIQGIAGLSESAEPFDHFGDVIEIGDWNGDGRPDVAFGVPSENLRDGQPDARLDAGTLHILFGQTENFGTAGQQTWNWDDPLFAFGAISNANFAAALAAGDFDGDGIDDLAIGAPGAAWDGQAQTGLVQILYGEAKLIFADNFEFGSVDAWSSLSP